MDREFTRHFGKTLYEATMEWHSYLLGIQETFTDDLPRVRHYWRVQTAYGNKLLLKAIEEEQTYVSLYGEACLDTKGRAYIHFLLGNWQECRQQLQEVLQSQSPEDVVSHSLAWLVCGFCYDMEGSRNEAIECYKRALSERDRYDWLGVRVHKLAKQYMKRPFGAADHLCYQRHFYMT